MRKTLFMTKISIIVMLMIIAGSLVAADGDGGYAGAFMQIPIGARPAGMSAYLAVSDDAAGALYNVAGLSSLQSTVFGTSYRVLQLDRKLGYASVLFPGKSGSVIGLHWLYAGTGSVKARDRNGNELGRDFSFNNHVFGFIFSKRFSDVISGGTKINYLQSSFPEVTAYSISFEFGLMFYLNEFINREKRDKFPVQDLQAGITVKNAGAQFMWNSEKYTKKYTTDYTYAYEQKDKFPIEGGIGVSGKLLKRKLLVASDLKYSENQHVRFYGGTEYTVAPEFALRAGYGDKRLSAGAGFQFKVSKRIMLINYAFSSDKAGEGSEHIFSFDVMF